LSSCSFTSLSKPHRLLIFDRLLKLNAACSTCSKGRLLFLSSARSGNDVVT
jgi:hypothetical protein